MQVQEELMLSVPSSAAFALDLNMEQSRALMRLWQSLEVLQVRANGARLDSSGAV